MNTIQYSEKQGLALDYLFDKTTKTIVWAGAWRAGKTFLALVWGLLVLIKRKNVRIIVGRKEFSALRATTITTLFSEVFPKLGCRSLFTWHDTHHVLKNKRTGSEMVFRGLDPKGKENTLGGLTGTHAIVDEASELTEDILVDLSARLSGLDDQNVSKLLIVSNPDKGFLYRKFFLPHESGELPEDTKFISICMHDNPFLTDDYLSRMTREKLGDAKYELFVLGNWKYTVHSNALFLSDDIYSLFTSDKTRIEPSKDRIISVDPSGEGKDSTIITYWDGFYLQDVIEIQISDITHVVGIINDLRVKYNVPPRNVIIDSAGLGISYQQMIRGSTKFIANAAPLEKENFGMLKDQMVWRFAKFVREKKMGVSPSLSDWQDRLERECIEHRSETVDQDVKQRCTKKIDVKKKLGGQSPDLFDSCMQRFWYSYRKSSPVISCLTF